MTSELAMVVAMIAMIVVMCGAMVFGAGLVTRRRRRR